MKLLAIQAIALLPAMTLAQTANNVAAQALQQARSAIASLVQANSRLTPEFVRMGFHDCVGGCDGCIDLSNPDNNGLAHPISVLDPIVKQFATANTGVSRADIWALAAMVGADVANHGTTTQPISFTQNWFGRVNCENSNSVCVNGQGSTVPCSSTAGPHRVLPSTKLNSAQVFSYFATNFGFNERQTVTAMGAHTVGRLVKSESGIDGPNGWTIDNVKLQHEYYQALMGAATAATPVSQIQDNSPNWVRFTDVNTGNGFPNVNRWQLSVANLNLVMLNTDIALVRDLNATSVNPSTGAVSCTFNTQTGGPACGVRVSTAQIAAQFADSNDLWLNEFKTVMDLILTNGYTRIPCSSAVCPLAKSRIAPPPTTGSPPVPPPTNRPTPPPIAPPPTAPVAPKTPSLYSVPPPPVQAPTANGWKMTTIGSRSVRASCGSDGTFAMLDGNRNTWVSNMGSSWSQYPGQALDVAVIDRSRIYKIGNDQRVYRWTGSTWNAMGVYTKSISAASDGTVAVVNSQTGSIWVKTGYDDNTNWRQVPYVSGALKVAIVQNGWLYYIGSDRTIYYTDMVRQPVRVGHSGVEISAGPDGSLVTVNLWNDIWSHTGGRNVESWFQVPGKATGVATRNSKTIVTVTSVGTLTRCDFVW